MQTDVLIVGAGPSGLVLANMLAAHGVRFLIVDRKPGPVEESRAALVHVRTLELLHGLGFAERAIDQGVKITRVDVHDRGRLSAEIPLAGHAAATLTPFPFALGIEQGRIERLLVDGLTRTGHAVRCGTASRRTRRCTGCCSGPTGRMRGT